TGSNITLNIGRESRPSTTTLHGSQCLVSTKMSAGCLIVALDDDASAELGVVRDFHAVVVVQHLRACGCLCESRGVRCISSGGVNNLLGQLRLHSRVAAREA